MEEMSEKLEEKYKYMCKLVEQMASSLHKAGDIIEANEDMSRDLFEYKKVVAGAQKKEELLLDYIDNMCAMIEYQVSPKEHDRWLEDCIKMGFYTSENDENGK